ncbi:MAG: beta-lactamase family protein [Sphingomonadaceae bacterium]|nr:beta-lactamase family protein [Sphingomonadaceae bacterium]
MTEIHGTCDARFEPVKAAFANNFTNGLEVGASVAVSHRGETVVDLWAGHRDAAKTQDWREDTIVNVWSSTKTMAAMSLLMLADRGDVDLYAPVSRYWPEFAANGKEDVEVRMFLSHSAGLSAMDEAVEGDALYDWDWMTSALARQAPWWEAGSQSGYHALTQGHLIGEIVRRVTGQTIGEFFAAEIAGPLGADFHIGTPDSCDLRIAELIPPAQAVGAPEPSSIAGRTFANPAVDVSAVATRKWRAAEIPAANGHGNARSIVKIQTAMANGGEASGKRLLSEKGTRRIFDEQTNGPDLVLGLPIRFGMGYGLNNPLLPLSPNENSCFWGGYGGSIVLVDQDARLCLSYVMNRMESGLMCDMRGLGLAQAAYASLVST